MLLQLNIWTMLPTGGRRRGCMSPAARSGFWHTTFIFVWKSLKETVAHANSSH